MSLFCLPMCRVLTGVVACVALVACSSPQAHFHRLVAADEVAVAVPLSALLVDVLPVRVPPSVAGRRLVVQRSSGEVDVLEMDRWASPLADEIRAALSSGLALRTSAMDRHGLPYDGKRPAYRVAVDVQRFDAWRGSHVLIDAVWTLRTADDRPMLTCRSVVNEDVSAGIDGVVQGQRRALNMLASQMAEPLLAYATAPSEPVRPMPGCVDSSARMLAN